MSDEPAVQFLRHALTRLRSQPWERDHFDPARARASREQALSRFAMLLSPERVAAIDTEALLGLLRDMKKQFEMGHGRGVPKTADLPLLQEALAVLVDEKLPLKDRLDRLRPQTGDVMVSGFGPSLITAILHFVDPDRYGMLNATSESVLRRLGVYPDLPGAASLALRYDAVNTVLIRLASALEIDLGQLNYLLSRVQPQALADFAAPQPHAR